MAEAVQSTFNRRTQIAPPGVRQVAERQWGVASREQLVGAGMSGAGISRALARAWLVRIHPGVFAFTHSALTVEARVMAALLYAGPDAALSHTTAGWWWRVIQSPPAVIHLSTSRRRAPRPGVMLHKPRRVLAVQHRGLAVTPVPRTLGDLAATLHFDQLRRALAEADFRGLLDPAAVVAACGPGRPGARSLRRALAAHLPELAETLSLLEERFLILCERHRIAIPRVNVVVCGLKVDALWEDERVIVELDGHDAHDRPAFAERDHGRDLILRGAGYDVRRYTWTQVTRREHEVAADLIAALGDRGPAAAGATSDPRALPPAG